ncbi:MAG: ABC transporter permease subunit [Clostridia bacterium]|nr:ABC transporter permease subunit [Clostridia bacterium]
MKSKKEKREWIAGAVKNVLYPLLALAVIIGMWAILAAVKNKPLLLPMPSDVFERFFLLFGEQNFWTSVFSSLGRTCLAFALSFIPAYSLALAAIKVQALSKIFDTVVAVLRAAPTVAVILIAYAFMQARTMTVVVGVLIALPILYSAFSSALRGVDKNLLSMARTYQVSRSRILFHAYFCSILPFMFDISRSTISLTLKVVIAAEILTLVSKSVGGAIQVANATFEMSYLLAWTTMAIVLSFALEIIVAGMKKFFVRWEK